MQFFDLFEHSEDYPENVAERGVPQNTLYAYISSAFLNGYINYVTVFWSCVLERYEIWKNINKEVWEEYIAKSHLHLKDFGDDILILAETENSYWFFWFDCDISDCQIGRIDKSITTKEGMKNHILKWIASHNCVERQPGTSAIVGKYYEIPSESFERGWTSF